MNKSRQQKMTVKIVTLGCKVNQYESDTILGDLKKNGFIFSAQADTPDLLIINTCSVTDKASRQSRQAIRKAIREHPDAVICVTGCDAQSEPHAIAEINGVDYVIGNSHKPCLPDGLDLKNLHKMTSPIILCEDILHHKFIEKAGTCTAGNRARPFVKIQDGCNDFCTYCIVPYTRGPSRSRNLKDVLNEIRFVSSTGAKEVVLTGIHLGRYGLDLSPASSLLILSRRILEETSIRLRISSIEPTELSDELLFLTVDSKRICPHFHIPLQSGDNDMLKKMNRPYNPEFFKLLVEKIHRLMPNCAIGVDVMVGFPGETEDAFNNTVNLVETLPISYLHIFPFSPRKLAPASRFADQVPKSVMKSRLIHVTQIGHSKKIKFYQNMIGQTLDVIVESQRDKTTGLLKGVSSNYVKVFFKGDDAWKNQLIHCQIETLLPLGNHTISVLGRPSL